jgi:hypothetical protein
MAPVQEDHRRLKDQTKLDRKGRTLFFEAAVRVMRRVPVDDARGARHKGAVGHLEELAWLDAAAVLKAPDDSA